MECPFRYRSRDFFREGEKIFLNRTRYVEYMRDVARVYHRHEFLELAYVEEGSGIHEQGPYRLPVRAGNVILLNHYLPHQFRCPEGDRFSWINCCFYPSLLDQQVLIDREVTRILHIVYYGRLKNIRGLVLKDSRPGELGNKFRTMLAAYEERSFGYETRLLGFLLELLADVASRLQPTVEEACRYVAGELLILRRMLSELETRAKEDLRVGDIALAAGCSVSYAERIFRHYTGEPILKYLNRHRIRLACQLLESTSWPVEEIAYQVGFSSPSFFYRKFREITGSSPGEFRRIYQSPAE